MHQYAEERYTRVAVLGGIYSNHVALAAAIADAERRGAEATFCLGDLGAFGPNPDKTFPLLIAHNISTIRGNYDDSIARGLADCQCGYTDPRDNHFARISYDYTLTKTSARWRRWLGRLPVLRRIRLGEIRLLLSHGSPRRMNEFLWESTTPTHFLEKLCDDFETDVVLATHTGIPWSRRLADSRFFANVGAIGRPANDGSPRVHYGMLSYSEGAGLAYEPIELSYDHAALADEMALEGLPDEFIETINTGWWTTCNEILPTKERRRGKF